MGTGRKFLSAESLNGGCLAGHLLPLIYPIFTFVDYIWIRIHNMAEKFNLHFRVCQQSYYLIYYLINGIRGSVSRDFRPLYLSWFEPTKLCSTPRRFSFMIVVFTPKRISPHCPFKSNQTRDFNFDSVVFNLSQWCVAHHWDYLRGMLHLQRSSPREDFFETWSPWLWAMLHAAETTLR